MRSDSSEATLGSIVGPAWRGGSKAEGWVGTHAWQPAPILSTCQLGAHMHECACLPPLASRR